VKTSSAAHLAYDVITCERCPRLRNYCLAVAREKRKAFRDEDYWGKPIPNFGDPKARLLIVGLAPAAHGANRTGRMFTGDNSGRWLYRALHRAGFANQADCESADDGLELLGAVITSVAHCAPPDNKPLPIEIANCSEYFERTFELHRPLAVVALGGIAWKAVFSELKRQGRWFGALPKFGHLTETKLKDGMSIIGSYHPSQQNTFTKRLTEPMLDAVFSRANQVLAGSKARKPKKS
jgi:uracil-DNA glycosylase family 4